MILQQAEPEDYVIATGQQYSVREFIERTAGILGIPLEWEGEGVNEIGRVASTPPEETNLKAGDVIVRIDPRYFRPTEVETLLGDASKARDQLGWVPKISFAELVEEMVSEDLQIAQRDALITRKGYRAFNHHE
jgi:GDPmannose 4,6-dehydratase